MVGARWVQAWIHAPVRATLRHDRNVLADSKPMSRPVVVTVAFVSLVMLSIAPPAQAQTRHEAGRRATFTAGASLGDGETALATSLGLGFRLSALVGLEFELAHARKLDFTLDLCPPPAVCVRGGQLPVTGRTLSLVPHVTIDLLPGSHRLRAYALAGVGAGHVRQRYFDPLLISSDAKPVEFTRSNVTVAVSFGGGVAVQISRRVAVGLDLRSLHVLDEKASTQRFIMPSGALDTLRIGSRVSWAF
jgi:opacity protein-like surface antigen